MKFSLIVFFLFPHYDSYFLHISLACCTLKQKKRIFPNSADFILQYDSYFLNIFVTLYMYQIAVCCMVKDSRHIFFRKLPIHQSCEPLLKLRY